MKIDLTATKFELTVELEKYAHTKVVRLVRKVPRRLRADAVCHVTFSQVHRKGVESNSCKVVLTLDDAQLIAEETTLHMYSSLDVATVRISKQLKDFVARQGGRGIRGVLHAYVRPPAR